jgi:hypothetical protein
MISFPCTHCGKGLKVKDDLAGKKGRCPHCKQAFRVPGPAVVAVARSPEASDSPLADFITIPPSSSRQDGAGDTNAPLGDTAPLSKELYDYLAPAQAPDEIGRLGPYRVLKVLGTGGMGIVFQAEDLQLKRIVALKAMLPTLAASPSIRERFTREAQIAAAIEHDHIVTILQVGEDRGVPFLAMPLLKGEVLEDRIQRLKWLPTAEVLRIGRETAQGLAAAHARGLMHRDIKPANIWLEDERGRVKILDFGLARAAGQSSQLTQQGAIVGTPAYMAPEQARGQAVDAHCDLFSLGCVLYEASTGKLPFMGSDAISTLMAIATASPKPPCQVNPEIPPVLSSLIMELLAKDPAARPPSAKSVIDEITAIERGERRVVVTVVPARKETVLVVEPAETDAHNVLPLAEPFEQRRDLSLARLWPWIAGAAGILMALMLIVAVVIFSGGSRPGNVTMTVDPPNVEILVDGRPVARDLVVDRGVVRFEVDAGKHEMKVTKDGFEPYTVQFTVTAGQTEEMRVHLQARKDSPLVGKTPNPNPQPRDPPDNPKPPKRDQGESAYRTITIGRGGRQFVAAADSKHFASRQENGTIRFWDATSADKTPTEFDLQSNGPGRVALSADGKKLAAFSHSIVKVWEVEGERELASSKANPGVNVMGVTFASDGRILATLCAEAAPVTGLIQIYDLESKNEVVRFVGHNSSVKWVLLSPDCARALSSGDDNTLRVWDGRDGQEKYHLSAPDRAAKCMAISPDGKRALTSHFNSEVHVWDLVEGKELQALKGPDSHFGEVDAVAFSADGRLAITGGFDSIIRVWDLRTGKIVGRLKGESIIVSLAVPPSGETVFAGSFIGKIHCFKLPKEW